MLAINDDDELDESTINGFDGESQTLHCSNLIGSQLLQVTRFDGAPYDFIFDIPLITLVSC